MVAAWNAVRDYPYLDCATALAVAPSDDACIDRRLAALRGLQLRGGEGEDVGMVIELALMRVISNALHDVSNFVQ